MMMMMMMIMMMMVVVVMMMMMVVVVMMMMMMMCKRLAQVPMLCVPTYNMKLAMMRKNSTYEDDRRMVRAKRGVWP